LKCQAYVCVSLPAPLRPVEFTCDSGAYSSGVGRMDKNICALDKPCSCINKKVVEVIDFAVGEILDYSYTIYQGQHKIVWYDPQPHLEEPNLRETFPHHKHVSPNIRKNRKPAHGINFDQLNLPVLIEEIKGFSL